jgi:hypothetical protein
MMRPAISSFSGQTPLVVMVTFKSMPKEGWLLPGAKGVERNRAKKQSEIKKAHVKLKEERTLVVLIVLLHQIAAHVTVLKHLLQLCGESRPALLHARISAQTKKHDSASVKKGKSTVLRRAMAAFSRSMLLKRCSSSRRASSDL